jgi:hypothetical protein
MREGESEWGCGPLEMVGVGRSRPQRASWAWSPRCACGSCARAVGEDETDTWGPWVNERGRAGEGGGGRATVLAGRARGVESGGARVAEQVSADRVDPLGKGSKRTWESWA